MERHPNVSVEDGRQESMEITGFPVSRIIQSYWARDILKYRTVGFLFQASARAIQWSGILIKNALIRSKFISNEKAGCLSHCMHVKKWLLLDWKTAQWIHED